MNQQKIVENEGGNSIAKSDGSEDTLPKKKTFLQRIDHPLIAAIASFLAPTIVGAPFVSMGGMLYDIISPHLSKKGGFFFYQINVLVWLFIGAWLAGLILGTWMPKSIKKSILWTYGIIAIPFHFVYIFPYMRSNWEDHIRTGSSLPFTLLYLALNLCYLPAIFFGVYYGSKWASERRLKRLETVQGD
jgi:predicted permease